MSASCLTPATSVLASDAELLSRTECPVESLTIEERVALLEQQVARLALAHANLVLATAQRKKRERMSTIIPTDTQSIRAVARALVQLKHWTCTTEVADITGIDRSSVSHALTTDETLARRMDYARKSGAKQFVFERKEAS